jgi:hypothetical protein|tara:strand:- start:9590 stop:10072 length:483 start_codon:yes stop_codon:yes gene_type:complete
MYPHQVLMEQNNLQKTNLSPEAQNYLTDFNHMLRGISLKESRADKKGEEYVMSEIDINKLNRFSKSVCVQIYEDMNTTFQQAKLDEEKKKKIEEESKVLKKQQEEEDAKRLAENERLKKEERLWEEQRAIEESTAIANSQAKAQAQAEESKKGGLFDYFF